MTTETPPKAESCNCLALRQAARHVTQFYDQFLAASGLRTTQFSILAKLRWLGPLTINALAKEMVMDRTTLGRNILPLEREGLIDIAPGRHDRRSKELRLSEAGRTKLRQASAGWAEAQVRFEAAFGQARSLELRGVLRAVSATELAATPANER
jgi:DNA-binding MarR family transcriptional regulator